MAPHGDMSSQIVFAVVDRGLTRVCPETAFVDIASDRCRSKTPTWYDLRGGFFRDWTSNSCILITTCIGITEPRDLLGSSLETAGPEKICTLSKGMIPTFSFKVD